MKFLYCANVEVGDHKAFCLFTQESIAKIPVKAGNTEPARYCVMHSQKLVGEVDAADRNAARKSVLALYNPNGSAPAAPKKAAAKGGKKAAAAASEPAPAAQVSTPEEQFDPEAEAGPVVATQEAVQEVGQIAEGDAVSRANAAKGKKSKKAKK